MPLQKIYKSTPWGATQSHKVITEGIVFYETAGHGGFRLSDDHLATLNSQLKLDSNSQLKRNWFEEDCEWALLATAFPELFSDAELVSAFKTLRNDFPEIWENYYGMKLLPGQSRKRDEDDFMRVNADNLLVTAAWGSWAVNVPSGFVGVYAKKGSELYTSGSKGSYWLVPESEYNMHMKTGKPWFVVDTKKHQSISVHPDRNVVLAA